MSDKKCRKNCVIEHEFRLAPSLRFGATSESEEFAVTSKITVDYYKCVKRVTIDFPAINFQILETNPRFGGFVVTTSGFLCSDLRPTGTVPRSIVAASYDGALPYINFTIPGLPTPIPGYIMQIDNGGALTIAGAGTPGTALFFGRHAVLPCSISYIVECVDGLDKNIILSDGFTNTTQFIDTRAANNGIRDSHVNDAFNNVVAWCWQDNSMIVDKTNGSSNVIVSIGQVINYKIKNIVKTQLTNYSNTIRPFDTAIAINRTNSDNLVASWGYVGLNALENKRLYSYSFDGGVTWSAPGSVSFPGLSDDFGDCVGVKSDKYGNFWYGFSIRSVDSITPAYAVSTDGGITFQLIYTGPTIPPLPFGYDYPQYCFGNKATGEYGLYFYTNFNDQTGRTPFVGFIPIPVTGPVPIATADAGTLLPKIRNQIFSADIAASDDGRVWFYGPNTNQFGVGGVNTVYKSPGEIFENYAGPWVNTVTKNTIPTNFLNPWFDSQPVRGYISCSIKSVIYDNKRQALYGLCAQSVPTTTQNMRINLTISRNNGQTWSDPFEISTSHHNNRGFQSMALDTNTGNLVFGWYDGRNDPTKTGIEYFAAILKAKKLSKLVKAIPLTNPILLTGPANIEPMLDNSDPISNEIISEWSKIELESRM